MKQYIEAREENIDHTREITRITINSKTYNIDFCAATGCENIDGVNCLAFLCRIGKRQFHVYCEENKGELKYFIVK